MAKHRSLWFFFLHLCGTAVIYWLRGRPYCYVSWCCCCSLHGTKQISGYFKSPWNYLFCCSEKIALEATKESIRLKLITYYLQFCGVHKIWYLALNSNYPVWVNRLFKKSIAKGLYGKQRCMKSWYKFIFEGLRGQLLLRLSHFSRLLSKQT